MSNTNTLNDLLPDSLNQEELPNTQQPSLAKDDEILDMTGGFDFDDYQVVRREFFAHIKEPSVTFNECKLYVNAACLSKFPNASYAQVLINQKKKILALRPCEEGARDSFMWCNSSNSKRKAKSITCKLFFAKLVSLMDWNPNYRYKLLGKLIHANGEYLIAFDLTSTEIYRKAKVGEDKMKVSRTPVYPSDWQNQFGLPFNEHKQSLQINIFDGYAIYSIKETGQDNHSEVLNDNRTTE